MPTTSVRPAPPVFDARLARQLVLINGAVPFAMLGLDAWRGRLGVNAANYLIRSTGILGLIFLCLTLAVTPLRRLTGKSVLVAFRRRLGLYAFAYIAVHFVLYWLLDRAGNLGSALHEILTRRYLQLGAIALLAMLPLALTSTDGMVTRLGAPRWKALHRLAYLAGVLGALHYILLVKSDLRQPLVFAGVLGALLGYRAVRHYADLRALARRPAPARRSATAAVPARPRFWQGELRIARIFDETHDVKTLRLTAVDGGPLPFAYEPGQYLNLALEIDGRPVRRSYTIASSPTRADYCEVTIKRKPDGYASLHLHATAREGDLLRVSAPAGRFVFTGGDVPRVVLIAGGVGITPLMSMVRALTDRCWRGEIDLVFAARTQRDVVFREELEYLQRRFPGLHVCVVLSNEPDDAWRGERGRITEALLRRVVPGLDAGPVYLCGPEPMMLAVREVLGAMGVPEAQVHTEAFVSPPTPRAEAPGDLAVPEASPPEVPDARSVGGDGVVTIRFATSGCSAEATRAQSLLEIAEEAGVSIPFECRSGICGQCKTRLLGGDVVMDVSDALTAADRRKGLILACQARPARDVTLEA